MKNFFWLFAIAVLISSCDTCAEDIQEISEICDQTPSTANLLNVRIADFDGYGSKILNDPASNIDVCSLHFSASDPSGQQFTQATEEINRIEGSEMSFTRTWVSHRTKSGLYPASPSDNSFDYVDNDVNVDPFVFPCHPAGDDTLCTSWVMNCCRHNGTDWQGSGNSDFFTVGVNSHCYDHYNDPSSKDFPYKHGILHELGHGIGMNHSDSWDAADKPYISTMQGKLVYLSSGDVSFMRERYPMAMTDHRNYVASSKTRFDNGSGGFNAHVFWEDNPQSFYIDGNGDLLDCNTNQAPYFYVAWFNTGNIDGQPDICGVNRIFLRQKYGTGAEIDLHVWKIATMPYLSQDQWQGTTTPTADELAQIDFSKDYELVFKVNGWSSLDELTDEDNELSYEVNLFETGPCTQRIIKERRIKSERKYANRKRKFVD